MHDICQLLVDIRDVYQSLLDMSVDATYLIVHNLPYFYILITITFFLDFFGLFPV